MSISMERKVLAPIVIVAFNRVEHFKETLSRLSANPEATQSALYICVDGWRNEEDRRKQDEICAFAQTFRKCFSGIELVRRERNLGLASNIVTSISEVLNEHEKIIVLEDDIVVSSVFLRFMNDALDYFRDEPEVWHIAAHTIVNDPSRVNDVFLWRYMNCWGWATWKDRWSHFEKDPAALIADFSQDQIADFDIDATGSSWAQVVANYEGSINTWAVFWYATIFKNKGLCLNPWYSYAKNIGLDGTGVNCGADEVMQGAQRLNYQGYFTPPVEIKEDAIAASIMIEHYKKKSRSLKSITRRVLRDIIGDNSVNSIKKLIKL